MDIKTYYVLTLTFFTLLTVLYFMNQYRNQCYLENFSSADSSSCPSGEFCGSNIKINEIASKSNNNILINSDANINTLNTFGISTNSNNFITINEDGKKVLGSEENIFNISDDQGVIFSNDVIMKPNNTMFSEDVLFMDNTYFRDKISLDMNSRLCFFDDQNLNCLKKTDIEVVMNVDVDDLDNKYTIFNGACITSDSLLADNLNKSADGTINVFPLNSKMTCISETSGVTKLKGWYDQKDSLEPIETTETTETTGTTEPSQSSELVNVNDDRVE